MRKGLKLFFTILVLALLAIIFLLALNFRNDLSLEELKTEYADIPSQFIEMEGMPVHYREEGPKRDSLPPVVLLHGTGASLHTWNGWVEILKDRYRILRLDLPGYGLTGPNPEGDYSYEFYSAFLLRFLDRIGVDSFVLGGNSLGGAIAWRTALLAPERVSSLILVDPAGYPVASKSRPLAFRMAAWPVINRVFRYVTPRSVVEKSVLNVYADKSKVSQQLVDRYYDLALREGNRQAFIDRMKGQTGPEGQHRLISGIEAPTLILWGAEDELIPVAAAQRFHDDLPNDTLVILDGLGHVPMEEDPARSAAPVLDFLHSLKN